MMELTFSKCEYRNPAEIIAALGLEWGPEYAGMSLETGLDGSIVINCPDEIADDIRDLIEPYKAKADFRLSPLYTMTQADLMNYIDDNVTNLAEAKQYIKKLSAVVLYLVKHTRLDK